MCIRDRELVGEIWDEHDEVIETFQKQADGSYLIACSADLDDMYDLFQVKGTCDAATVSGWVMEQVGRVPEVGDHFQACLLYTSSATETAFTSLNRIRLRTKADAGSIRAAKTLELAEEYEREKRGVRLLRLEHSYQLCSAPEQAAIIRRTLESRKPPKLSQPALEVLEMCIRDRRPEAGHAHLRRRIRHRAHVPGAAGRVSLWQAGTLYP